MASFVGIRTLADGMCSLCHAIGKNRQSPQVGGINSDELATMDNALRRLERFWTHQILYRPVTDQEFAKACLLEFVGAQWSPRRSTLAD